MQTSRPSDGAPPLPPVPAETAASAAAAAGAAPPGASADPPIQRAVDVGEMVTGPAAVGGVEDTVADDASSLTTQVMRRLTEDRQEMAILVDRLYPQLRDELRWELRAQRERAGLLADPL